MAPLAEAVWGTGDTLDALQMSFRSVIVFLITYLLIRVSGRRSFSQGSAVDTIIVILLGAIMSRAVTGASPFLPVVAASATLSLLHRICAWIMIRYPRFTKRMSGKRIHLFDNGHYLQEEMKRSLVSEAELLQAVRKELHQDDLSGIAHIYMENNGKISIIRSTSQQQGLQAPDQ